MSANSLVQNLVQINHFFDCNYSAVVVSVRGYSRGYSIAIIFKNKLIYESDYFIKIAKILLQRLN